MFSAATACVNAPRYRVLFTFEGVLCQPCWYPMFVNVALAAARKALSRAITKYLHCPKELTWLKLEGQEGDFAPGQYFILGSWNDFNPAELQPDTSRRRGWFSTEVQMTSLGIEFRLMMNQDESMMIYPVPADKEDRMAPSVAAIGGPDGEGRANWRVEDAALGSVFRVSFFRDPDDCEPTSMRMDWVKAPPPCVSSFLRR